MGFSIINHPFWGTLILETPIWGHMRTCIGLFQALFHLHSLMSSKRSMNWENKEHLIMGSRGGSNLDQRINGLKSMIIGRTVMRLVDRSPGSYIDTQTRVSVWYVCVYDYCTYGLSWYIWIYLRSQSHVCSPPTHQLYGTAIFSVHLIISPQFPWYPRYSMDAYSSPWNDPRIDTSKEPGRKGKLFGTNRSSRSGIKVLRTDQWCHVVGGLNYEKATRPGQRWRFAHWNITMLSSSVHQLFL